MTCSVFLWGGVIFLDQNWGGLANHVGHKNKFFFPFQVNVGTPPVSYSLFVIVSLKQDKGPTIFEKHTITATSLLR